MSGAAIGSQGLFPWQTDSAVTNAWIADRQHLTIATGVSSWAPTKGNVFLTQGTGSLQPSFTSNFGSNNRGCLTYDGTDDYLAGDGVSALITGTSQPLSLSLSLQLTTQKLSHLVSFGRSIATPAPNGPYWVIYTTNASSNVAITRNNDSNNGVQGTTTQTITTASRVVITLLSNGSTAAIRFNGAATSVTAQTVGTTMTLNKFVLGASAVVSAYGGTPAAAKIRAFVIGNSLWNSTTYTAIENYLINE